MDSLAHITTVMAIALILSGPVARALAQRLEVNGFAQVHAAARTADVDCPAGTECDVPFNDQRLRLKVEGDNASGSLGLLAKLELVHDSVLEDTKVDVRELYGDYNADQATLRAGRQIITWGVGDLLFINDIFPKDWVAFFSGLPLEYLKLGSDVVKLDLYPESADLEIVVGDFRRDRLPDSRRFLVPSPVSTTLPRTIDEPSGLDLALRLSRHLKGWDTALYAARTHFGAPSLLETGTEVRGSYARLNTIGASLSGSWANGVLNLEAGYYDSEDDRDGSDPAIENSQTRFLVGYSRQVGQDTTVGVQGFVEWMHDYGAYKSALPAGFPQRDRVRTLATVRFTQRYYHQTLIFNVFTFLGITDDDAYLIPSLRYAFSDTWWGEVGANIFTGSRKGMFGALRDDSNVYLTVRLSF
jgi:hypothetical protein